jgi:hypothetical protein
MQRWSAARYGYDGSQNLHHSCVSQAPPASLLRQTEADDGVAVFLPAHVPLSILGPPCCAALHLYQTRAYQTRVLYGSWTQNLSYHHPHT